MAFIAVMWFAFSGSKSARLWRVVTVVYLTPTARTRKLKRGWKEGQVQDLDGMGRLTSLYKTLPSIYAAVSHERFDYGHNP